MERRDTSLPGVVLLRPEVYRDPRGFFLESYNRRTFAEHGVREEFVQDNHSRSVRGVVRGLHYQLGRGQAKLLRATVGRIWDVAVDIRHGSPTFGRWTAVELDAESHEMVYVPAGFAHGFTVLSAVAEVQYKCSDFYDPGLERGIAWDDPGLAIPWPLEGPPVVSAKDAGNPRLAEVPEHDLPAWKE